MKQLLQKVGEILFYFYSKVRKNLYLLHCRKKDISTIFLQPIEQFLTYHENIAYQSG